MDALDTLGKKRKPKILPKNEFYTCEFISPSKSRVSYNLKKLIPPASIATLILSWAVHAGLSDHLDSKDSKNLPLIRSYAAAAFWKENYFCFPAKFFLVVHTKLQDKYEIC